MKTRRNELIRMGLHKVELHLVGWPDSTPSGTTPPTPTEDNLWLWEDSTPVLWGDGSNIPTDNEQLTISD